MRRQLAEILRQEDNGLKPLVIEAARDIHFPETVG